MKNYRNSHRSRSKSKDKHDRHNREDDHRRHTRDKGKNFERK